MIDNRLKFMDRQSAYEKWDDTVGQYERAVGYASPSTEAVSVGKSTDIMLGCDGERNLVAKHLHSHCREKSLARSKAPVPQTDTGG